MEISYFDNFIQKTQVHAKMHMQKMIEDENDLAILDFNESKMNYNIDVN